MNPATDAFIAACRAEIEAPKPGNVHVFSGGHDMEARHFLESAAAAAGPLTDSSLSPGHRVLRAVEATMVVAGTNTNLGILLLCMPLHAAFECTPTAAMFEKTLGHVLDSLDARDSQAVFSAIRLANPGGMGRVEENDLTSVPQSGLRAIMAQAKNRDRIANSYADGFNDIFKTGIPRLNAAQQENREPWWPATAVYLNFLSQFPDTHVVRKWGNSASEWLQSSAADVQNALPSSPDRLGMLLAFDAAIKARGINPGTSADLTVATLFAASLLDILRQGPESG